MQILEIVVATLALGALAMLGPWVIYHIVTYMAAFRKRPAREGKCDPSDDFTVTVGWLKTSSDWHNKDSRNYVVGQMNRHCRLLGDPDCGKSRCDHPWSWIDN